MLYPAISMGNFMSWTLILGLTATMAIGLIALAILAVSKVLPSSGENAMRGMTTFVTVLVGMIILLVIFYLMMEQRPNQDFDNVLKAASLVITPLGTFIGFVAGQSAGSAGADKAVEVAKAGQAAGVAAAGKTDKIFETLLAQERQMRADKELTVEVMASMMSEQAVADAHQRVRSIRT